MFALRIRNALLSLAVVAAVATSLPASIAAAAPSQPLPNTVESLAAQPTIDLAQADYRVTKMFKRGDRYTGEEYIFKVWNHGPDKATVKITESVIWFDANGVMSHHEEVYEETYASGEGRAVLVACTPPAGGKCHEGAVRITVRGIDRNTSNNSESYVYPLSN